MGDIFGNIGCQVGFYLEFLEQSGEVILNDGDFLGRAFLFHKIGV
ncbi:hypothetical protein ES703_107597 [subsurface metagenome]